MKETQRRYSKQRQLILEAVQSSKLHPTAEDVYGIVKLQNPGISLGTVYRNLNLLTKLGEITNLNQGLGGDHFDAVCTSHPHLFCTCCQKVFDLDYDISSLSGELAQKAATSEKAEISSVRVAAFGLCAACKKQQP